MEVESSTTDIQSKKPVGIRSVLAHRDYARLWTGQLVSNIGSAISSLALLFFVYDLTNSALAMAILAMIQTLPVVIFAGFIGVYVDRWDRKKIMIISDIIRAITILLIPLSIHFSSVFPTLYLIYILTFVYSTARAWFFPARSASIPNLVDGDELVAANSLSSMTFQIVQLIVPPIGGLLVAVLAPDYFLAFAIESIAFVVSAMALSGIATSLKPIPASDNKESFLGQVAEGARFVVNNSILSFLFIFAMLLAGSSGILNALLVPYLEGELGLGSIELGLLMAGGAASGALAAIYLGRKKKLDKPLYLVSGASLIAGFAVFVLVGATDFTGVLIAWAIIGCVDVILNIPLSVLMQELVDDAYRGRVFALLNVAFTSIQVAGMGIGGIWAESAGSTGPAFLGAAIALVAVGLIGFLGVFLFGLHRKLHEMQKPKPLPEPPTDGDSIIEFTN